MRNKTLALLAVMALTGLGIGCQNFSFTGGNGPSWLERNRVERETAHQQAMRKKDIYYVIEDGDVAQLKLLLSNGEKVDKADQSGNQPIHFAAGVGNIEIVKVLIGAGAKADAWTQVGGYQPIHIAAAKGRTEMVKFLLAQGATASSQCGAFHNTPSVEASRSGYKDLAAFLKSQELKEASSSK